MAGDTTVALIGIGGVVIGGAVQFAAALIGQRSKVRIDTRTAAYQNYLDETSKISIFLGSMNNKPYAAMTETERTQFRDIQMNAQGARHRMALYASEPVLNKLGTFMSKHAMMATNEDVEAYLDFLEAMREDSYAPNYAGFRTDVDNTMLRGMMKA